jgi:hypothetical protein
MNLGENLRRSILMAGGALALVMSLASVRPAAAASPDLTADGSPLPREAVDRLGREDLIRLLELQEQTKMSLALASRRDLFLREHALGVPVSTVLPAIFLTSLLVAMALSLRYRLRVEQLRQETCRLLVSQDRPIPPELLATAREPDVEWRRGILLLAAGAAVAGFLAIAINLRASSAALIPATIGVAHLWLARRDRMGNEENLAGE